MAEARNSYLRERAGPGPVSAPDVERLRALCEDKGDPRAVAGREMARRNPSQDNSDPPRSSARDVSYTGSKPDPARIPFRYVEPFPRSSTKAEAYPSPHPHADPTQHHDPSSRSLQNKLPSSRSTPAPAGLQYIKRDVTEFETETFYRDGQESLSPVRVRRVERTWREYGSIPRSNRDEGRNRERDDDGYGSASRGERSIDGEREREREVGRGLLQMPRNPSPSPNQSRPARRGTKSHDNHASRHHGVRTTDGENHRKAVQQPRAPKPIGSHRDEVTSHSASGNGDRHAADQARQVAKIEEPMPSRRCKEDVADRSGTRNKAVPVIEKQRQAVRFQSPTTTRPSSEGLTPKNPAGRNRDVESESSLSKMQQQQYLSLGHGTVQRGASHPERGVTHDSAPRNSGKKDLGSSADIKVKAKRGSDFPTGSRSNGGIVVAPPPLPPKITIGDVEREAIEKSERLVPKEKAKKMDAQSDLMLRTKQDSHIKHKEEVKAGTGEPKRGDHIQVLNQQGLQWVPQARGRIEDHCGPTQGANGGCEEIARPEVRPPVPTNSDGNSISELYNMPQASENPALNAESGFLSGYEMMQRFYASQAQQAQALWPATDAISGTGSMPRHPRMARRIDPNEMNIHGGFRGLVRGSFGMSPVGDEVGLMARPRGHQYQAAISRSEAYWRQRARGVHGSLGHAAGGGRFQ